MEKVFFFSFTMFVLILFSFIKSFLYIKILNFNGELYGAILISRNFYFSCISLPVLGIISGIINAIYFFNFRISLLAMENYIFYLLILIIYVLLNETWCGLVNWILQKPFKLFGLICLLLMIFVPESCFIYLLMMHFLLALGGFLCEVGLCWYWDSEKGDVFNIFFFIYFLLSNFLPGIILGFSFL